MNDASFHAQGPGSQHGEANEVGAIEALADMSEQASRIIL